MPEIIFQTFENMDAQESYEFKDQTSYNKNFKKLTDDLLVLLEKQYKVVVTAVDKDVIKTHLKKQKIDLNGLNIVRQDATFHGFVDDVNKFALFSHAEIFGRKQVKTTKRRDHLVFMSKFAVNDYVVHEDHGVARYLGLVESKIEGHKRDNLLLEYAKGDRLYVPVELAYKVDRYIGEAKPKLHRLSGTSWVRLGRKARQDAQKYAKELLQLYAQRSLVRVDSWIFFKDADQKLHKTFGYLETQDQERAISDVYEDLQKNTPMDRLVVGDVGFGKTEVAIRAAYQAVLNNKQVAVLCPTTLLAQQHYDTFSNRLENMGVRVEMLSRFTGKINSNGINIKQVINLLQSGEVDVVIGTHRLLSKDINFKDIGLIIIDEEQRFGVKHKERLKKLRTQAHIVTLSATPIPRTLYFSLSGLREISTIQTPPKGRQSIHTKIASYNEKTVKSAIEYELKRGGQVFYLYNRVQTIQTMKNKLIELLGKKVRIAVVHGQMPETEMARVTSDFDSGKVDVLLCTTIIENGLDMPNVNTLIVHNATRFGVGQLYQVRGRIGRGSVQAHAYLFYPEEGLSGIAAKRLQILEEAKELGSGFQLAMRDLEMRGMGQLLGKKQHGHVQAVGLGMYGRLLNQAVEELETGEVQQTKISASINLPLDYGIPEEMISDPEERVRFYRQISQVQNTVEMRELMKKYDDKIKNLSSSQSVLITNLLNIIELRIFAEQASIRAIDYQELEAFKGNSKRNIVIEFNDLSLFHVEILNSLIKNYKISQNSIIFDAELIYNYYTDLKNILSKLQK